MNKEQLKKYRREYMRKYNATQKGAEYNRNHVKKWRKENPELRKIQSRKESGMDKVYNQRKHLKYSFGISVETYNKMFEEQHGLCAICQKSETAKSPKTQIIKHLSVDHCHKTGKIRGLLCQSCNIGIGALKDSPEIMLEAIKYVSRYS